MFLFQGLGGSVCVWWSAGREISIESPLNGPRTFQSIDTADLAKAYDGWEERGLGHVDNLLFFKKREKKWYVWPKSQFSRKVEAANNSSWQPPIAT